MKRADGDDGQQFKKKLMNNTNIKHEANTGSERPSSVQKFWQLEIEDYFYWNESDTRLKQKCHEDFYRYADSGTKFSILVKEANVIRF